MSRKSGSTEQATPELEVSECGPAAEAKVDRHPLTVLIGRRSSWFAMFTNGQRTHTGRAR